MRDAIGDGRTHSRRFISHRPSIIICIIIIIIINVTSRTMSRTFVAFALALAFASPSFASSSSTFTAEAYVNVPSLAEAFANAPAGGRSGFAWYAATAYRDGFYGANGRRGARAIANDALELVNALNDPLIEFIDVNASAIDLSSDAWPRDGVVVRRAVEVARADGLFGAAVIRARQKSVMSIVDGGRVVVRDVDVEDGEGDVGGAFYFGRAHGGGSFENVGFRNNKAKHGGAVFIASAGATANVTFTKCEFVGNRATAEGGRGGAVFASAFANVGARFSQCGFYYNAAERGYGGAMYAEGGRVVIHACVVDGNWALGGGGVAFRGGGVVSTSTVANNVATAYGGGGLYMTSASGEQSETYASSVQRSTFRNNTATTAGGGAFVYGLVKMLANTFNENAIPASAPSGLDPNYYVCTDVAITGKGCVMLPEIKGESYDPATVDPFLRETEFASTTMFA